MRVIRFLLFFVYLICLAISAEIKYELISPKQKNIITRHPQVIIKYPSDITPIIQIDSISLLVNNVDYTNYIRFDLSTPELVLFFYSTKPMNIGENVIKVKGKLINDEVFENVFVIKVDPRSSETVRYYLDLINRSSNSKTKSRYCLELGKYYEKNGYYLDALSYYEQAMKLDKSNKKAKEEYNRVLSIFPNKATKMLNIVLDVSMVNLDVLRRNNIFVFRCVIENYRDTTITFNLNNFLVSSGSDYYQPIKEPYEYIRSITQRNLMTLDDFAICNYLLSKDVYNFNYVDEFSLEGFSQMKIDLMFNIKTKNRNLIFQFFKVSEKGKNKIKELPLYIKLPFMI
ncbi:MAG: tetratricopeptide repeat protein [bacterium]